MGVISGILYQLTHHLVPNKGLAFSDSPPRTHVPLWWTYTEYLLVFLSWTTLHSCISSLSPRISSRLRTRQVEDSIWLVGMRSVYNVVYGKTNVKLPTWPPGISSRGPCQTFGKQTRVLAVVMCSWEAFFQRPPQHQLFLQNGDWFNRKWWGWSRNQSMIPIPVFMNLSYELILKFKGYSNSLKPYTHVFWARTATTFVIFSQKHGFAL